MRPSWIQNGCGCVDHTNICEGSYKIALNIGNPLPLVLLILPLSSIQWIEQTVQVVRHCTVVQYRQTAQYPVSRKNRLICKGILSAIIGIGQYIYIYIYINLYPNQCTSRLPFYCYNQLHDNNYVIFLKKCKSVKQCIDNCSKNRIQDQQNESFFVLYPLR